MALRRICGGATARKEAYKNPEPTINTFPPALDIGLQEAMCVGIFNLNTWSNGSILLSGIVRVMQCKGSIHAVRLPEPKRAQKRK